MYEALCRAAFKDKATAQETADLVLKRPKTLDATVVRVPDGYRVEGCDKNGVRWTLVGSSRGAQNGGHITLRTPKGPSCEARMYYTDPLYGAYFVEDGQQ